MKRITLWIVVGVLLVAGVFVAGKKGVFKTGETPAASATASAPDKPAGRPAGDFVIATVNGEPIYHSEFNLAVESLPAAAKPIAAKASGRRVILSEIVKLKLLKQEAERSGLEKDPDVANQLAVTRDNILAASALERLVKDTPPDLKAFYEMYKNQFRGTRVRQVLISYQGGLIPPKAGGKAPVEAEARDKAAKIAERIRKGEDFAAVAKADSDDPQSGQRGGDLGLVRPGQLGETLEADIDKLELNKVSEPVKSPYGFHVFEVTGREVSPFEQVQSALASQGEPLRAQIVVNSIREKAKVETVNEDFFKDPGQ